jgi:putative Holliday junction resolvase
MRVLALDHGTARCGVALSDPSGTLARPLPVIEPSDPRTVARVAAEHDVELIVVGLPLSLSGDEGPQAEIAREFCAELAQLVEIPVETWDERFTTAMATKSARGGAEAAEDSLAAAHLLEGFLQSRAAEDS